MEEYYKELLSNARNPFLERLAKEQGIEVSCDFSQDAVGARERMIEDLANRWPTDIDGARKLLTIFLTTLCAPLVPEGAEEKTTRAPSSPTSASRMLLHPAVIVPGLMPDTFRISDIATVTDNILAVWQKQLEVCVCSFSSVPFLFSFSSSLIFFESVLSFPLPLQFPFLSIAFPLLT